MLSRIVAPIIFSIIAFLAVATLVVPLVDDLLSSVSAQLTTALRVK